MQKKDYIETLRKGVQEKYKCMAAHRRTVPVKEAVKAQTIWKGEVEVFWLTGHPQAKRCYAWASYGKDGTEELTAILEIPPVIGPATAVQAALATKPG